MQKMFHVICDVCRVVLHEGHNLLKKEPDHFADVCIEHSKYAKTFLVDVVSENLGFSPVDDRRECEFCDKPLSNEEVQNSLGINSLHYLCKEHLQKHAFTFNLNKSTQIKTNNYE